MTAWAFDRRNSLEDMLFFRFEILDKGGQDIDSTFVAFWADMDIGEQWDLVGCDTSLSLGYNYKTRPSRIYGDGPPAVGLKLLQGPVVASPGDTAKSFLSQKPDFTNLPMTAFSFFYGGRSPPFADPEDAKEAFYAMLGLGVWYGSKLVPMVDPTTGRATKFALTGNPLTGEGWVDVDHRDKRFLMASGPFYFAEGDTQEVVMAVIIAQGKTGLESVRQLKRHARIAQYAYDSDFVFPPPPPAPTVTTYADTASILLTWNDGAEAYAAVDRIDIDSLGNPSTYSFQGYNVYQLDAPEVRAAMQKIKIASFDRIDGVVEIRDEVFLSDLNRKATLVVQEATDSGVQCSFWQE